MLARIAQTDSRPNVLSCILERDVRGLEHDTGTSPPTTTSSLMQSKRTIYRDGRRFILTYKPAVEERHVSTPSLVANSSVRIAQVTIASPLSRSRVALGKLLLSDPRADPNEDGLFLYIAIGLQYSEIDTLLLAYSTSIPLRPSVVSF